MAEAAPAKEGVFHIPTNAQEFWALALSILAVLVLVQFGAPVVRELDFLDQKLRDYFIGIAFAAFPFIHRGAKQSLSGFKARPTRPDLAPWFVTGVVAAAVLFGWNQFVSACAGFAVGVFAGVVGLGDVEPNAFMNALATSILAISLPLSAVASVVAGIALNRNTRSHVFAALAVAGLMYIAFNVLLTWALQPEFLAAQFASAAAGGTMGMVYFGIGMSIVAIVVFVFGAIGVAISRYRRDASIGRMVEAARRLSPGERDAVTSDIVRALEARVTLAAARATAPGPAPEPSPPPVSQLATAAEP